MTPTKLLIGQIVIAFGIVIGGIWFATQWAAWRLDHQTLGQGNGVPTASHFDLAASANHPIRATSKSGAAPLLAHG